MELWIVCWVKGNNSPDMDFFTDHEVAMQCLDFVSKNSSSVIIRKITLVKNEEKAPEDAAEVPVESEETEGNG